MFFVWKLNVPVCITLEIFKRWGVLITKTLLKIKKLKYVMWRSSVIATPKHQNLDSSLWRKLLQLTVLPLKYSVYRRKSFDSHDADTIKFTEYIFRLLCRISSAKWLKYKIEFKNTNSEPKIYENVTETNAFHVLQWFKNSSSDLKANWFK